MSRQSQEQPLIGALPEISSFYTHGANKCVFGTRASLRCPLQWKNYLAVHGFSCERCPGHNRYTTLISACDSLESTSLMRLGLPDACMQIAIYFVFNCATNLCIAAFSLLPCIFNSAKPTLGRQIRLMLMVIGQQTLFRDENLIILIIFSF